MKCTHYPGVCTNSGTYYKLFTLIYMCTYMYVSVCVCVCVCLCVCVCVCVCMCVRVHVSQSDVGAVIGSGLFSRGGEIR